MAWNDQIFAKEKKKTHDDRSTQNKKHTEIEFQYKYHQFA